MGEPVAELRQVVKEHRDGSTVVRALGGIDFAVHAGEMVAVTGRSGSGKSTLLNVAGGLDEATSGEVFVEGRPLTSLTAAERAEHRRRHLGFVFQAANLVPALTAEENVALPLEFDGVRASKAQASARQALERVGLVGLQRRFPDELSGGQRQRVAIARAVVGTRRLILADEPTGALDDLTGRSMFELLAGLANEGAAVVVVTHDDELAAYAGRIIRLKDGRVNQVVERSAAPSGLGELLS